MLVDHPLSGVQSLQAIDMMEIDTVFEVESVSWSDVGGACAAVPQCAVDADCDVFGSCQAGADPCPGQFCDEGGPVCVPIAQDFDIQSVRATSRVKLSTGDASDAKVTLKNGGGAADVAELTVSAMHDGNEIFGITQLVQQQASNGRAIFDFSATPTTVADVIWTATLVDADPDVDTASGTTTVVP